MFYFIIVSIFLLFYVFLSRRYFRYAFFFLIFYFPFQLALNPPVAGIDIATGRLMIIILFFICIADFFNLTEESRARLLAIIKKDRIGLLLSVFLFFSAFSILWSENWIWGLRKWFVFASIFPLYWITLYALFTGNGGEKKSSRFAVMSEAIIFFLSLSVFISAASALIQFLSQFIWDGDKIFRFWARFFFPVFLGSEFGATVFRYQSWFVNISGDTIMRAVGFFPDPHTFGFYIGLSAPLAVIYALIATSRIRFFYFVGIGCLFVAFVVAFSRSAYVGFVLSCLFLFLILTRQWFRRGMGKKSAFIAIFMIIIVIIPIILITPVYERFFSIFNAKEFSNTERLKNWREALGVIGEYPIYGSGIGSYQLNINDKKKEIDGLIGRKSFSGAIGGLFYDNDAENFFGNNYRSPVYAHNTYLDIWAELGIIGLFLWLGIFLSVFAENFRILTGGFSVNNNGFVYIAGITAALIWFSVQSFFDTAIYSPVILPLLMVVLALNVFWIADCKKQYL